MLDERRVDRLRDAMVSADYRTDSVLARLTTAGQAGLGRNTTLAVRRALGAADDPQATMIRLWLLQQPVATASVGEALPVDDLLAGGVLTRQGETGTIRAAIDIRPYGSPDDGASGWVVSDLTPGLDQRNARPRPDDVLGVSPASTTLAQISPRTPVSSALDLGTGCGVQSLHLARHAERVVATDVNTRSLDMADLTARLNGVRVDLRCGSLFEPVAGERFDLVVTNPPYVMSPPTGDADRLTYREGSVVGDGLVRSIVERAPDHLNDGGTLLALANWAIPKDADWHERLSGWAPQGCDLWVIERERLDVYEYIELWLADAGLSGELEWEDRYSRWLAYFDALGIAGVGMGWIQVVKSGREHADIQIESWPYAVRQPVGPVFAGRAESVSRATAPDGALLATAWRLVDTTQEETGAPGVEHPQHVVLRQMGGLRRAITQGSEVMGILGACDGELPLRVLIDAVAELTGADTEGLTLDCLRTVRQAVRDQMLVAAGHTGGVAGGPG